jgi:hypothetical protein
VSGISLGLLFLGVTTAFGWLVTLLSTVVKILFPLAAIRQVVKIVDSAANAVFKLDDKATKKWRTTSQQIYEKYTMDEATRKSFKELGNQLEPDTRNLLRKFLKILPRSLQKFVDGKISLNNTPYSDFDFTVGDLNPTYHPSWNGRSLMVMAAMAYENKRFLYEHLVSQGWDVEMFQDAYTDLQGFVATKEKTVVLSFRGTEGLNPFDWDTDFTLRRKDLGNGILVHAGFYNAISDQYELINKHLQKAGAEDGKLWITGHSLGAALASVFTARLIIDHKEWVNKHLGGLYTFGQPRCGNKAYADLFIPYQRKNMVYRFVNCYDIMPQMPYMDEPPENPSEGDKMSTKKRKLLGKQSTLCTGKERHLHHHGNLIWMDADGNLKIVEDTQAVNYEQSRVILGFWSGVEKIFRGITEENAVRLLLRFILPFYLNDHLPSDYLKILEKEARKPLGEFHQILPIIRNLLIERNMPTTAP